MVGQTLLPHHWVIVDDGSTDVTPAILREYCYAYPWIRTYRREDRGRRSVGPGVIDAFYSGYNSCANREYLYLCKLDADLSLPSRYFETLISRMEQDPRLGTCSGQAYYRAGRMGRLCSEALSFEMSAGMTKFYRRECFEQIGGFVREVMWDGIDCHRCRMLGWKARTFDEPELRFVHLRAMGSSDKGVLNGRVRHGFGQYFMGTNWVYMLASSIFRMVHHPYLLGGAAMFLGFIASALMRRPRYADPEFRRFLRRYQWSCLLRGKKAATAKLEAQMAPAWDPNWRPGARAGFPGGVLPRGVNGDLSL